MVNETFRKCGDRLALVAGIKNQDDGKPHILRQIGARAPCALRAIEQPHDAFDDYVVRIMVKIV